MVLDIYFWIMVTHLCLQNWVRFELTDIYFLKGIKLSLIAIPFRYRKRGLIFQIVYRSIYCSKFRHFPCKDVFALSDMIVPYPGASICVSSREHTLRRLVTGWKLESRSRSCGVPDWLCLWWEHWIVFWSQYWILLRFRKYLRPFHTGWLYS